MLKLGQAGRKAETREWVVPRVVISRSVSMLTHRNIGALHRSVTIVDRSPFVQQRYSSGKDKSSVRKEVIEGVDAAAASLVETVELAHIAIDRASTGTAGPFCLPGHRVSPIGK